MKNVPTPVWICLTVAFVSVIGAFAYLTASGSNTTDFRSFLNTVLNFAGLLLSGGAVAYAGKAAQQTNGGLDARIKDAAKAALDEHQLGQDPKEQTWVK
jgi:hypothetical protein